MTVAMLQDMSKCMACRACQVACKEWNDLSAVTTTNRGTYENPPALSPNTWTRIHFKELAASRDVRWSFFKQQCLHCGDAPCVRVCPTAALKQNPMGFVSFEEEQCNGCGYCANFCPFGVPQISVSNTLTGHGKASKCTLCQDRVTSGLMPACAKTCPTGAIQFGQRGDMIALGQQRVADLKGKGFAEANLYGPGVLGGTGVMYVLPYKSAEYAALPANPQSSITAATLWQNVLQPVGGLAIGLGAIGLAVNFLVASRHIKDEEG